MNVALLQKELSACAYVVMIAKKHESHCGSLENC